MKLKKKRLGRVLSNKMDKTAVVEVVRQVRHVDFDKYYLKRKKYKVHDATNVCQIGDKVLIQETIPISREKRWALVEVVK